MRESASVRDGLRTLYERFSAHDPAGFDDILATDDRVATTRVDGRRARVGYATDTPRFVLPDGSFIPTRLTGVLHQEAGAWKVVHLHFSVGVPDEDAVQPPPG